MNGNSCYKLGDTYFSDSLVPTQIGMGYSAIETSGWHTIALKPDGSLWSLGPNYKKLTDEEKLKDDGDIGLFCSTGPKLIDTGYIAISEGCNHTLAIKKDQSLWAFGFNTNGQLGDGTNTDSAVPRKIGTGYIRISAGCVYSVAIKADRSLWAWGKNNSGQLGDGTTTDSSVPIQIGTSYSTIAAGFKHTLAIKSDHSLWEWGEQTLCGESSDHFDKLKPPTHS